MRWGRLFDDLEAQLAAAARADVHAEAADLQRLETSRQPLADRMRAATGAALRIQVPGRVVSGRVLGAGADWVLVDAAGADTLVVLDAVVWVEGLGRGADPPADEIDARLGFGHVLRQLARDRAVVAIGLRDSSVLTGTVDRVGADALDIAEHPADVVRRADAVTRLRTIPFASIATVRPGE